VIVFKQNRRFVESYWAHVIQARFECAPRVVSHRIFSALSAQINSLLRYTRALHRGNRFQMPYHMEPVMQSFEHDCIDVELVALFGNLR
jgi:hypothetical protein